VTNTHAPAPAAEAAVTMLEALGAELTGMGWTARLRVQAGRVPALHVQNPAAPQLADDIRAAPAEPGQPVYWWSWGDPVAAATPGEAAALISRALRTTPP
jgi:hypothetical protein